MTEEQWRTIPGYEGRYEASDHGRIRSLPRKVTGINGVTWTVRGGIMRSRPGSNGYLTTMVGRGSPQHVHRLVTAAFYGPCPEGLEVRHLDGDRANAQLSNLAYGTRAENMADKLLHGTNHQVNKTHCPKGHPYDDENTFIDGGSRKCKMCNRARARANHARKRAQLVNS